MENVLLEINVFIWYQVLSLKGKISKKMEEEIGKMCHINIFGLHITQREVYVPFLNTVYSYLPLAVQQISNSGVKQGHVFSPHIWLIDSV